jgi:cysteine desulfurase
MPELKLPIYLDNSATTPVDPRVVDEMIPYFTEKFGNASSRNHPFGWAAEEAVDYAREQVATLIGATSAKEIIFTSGATEAINLAIKGAANMYRRRGNHIITVKTEHKAVLDTCKNLQKQGLDVTYLEVDETGMISVEQVAAAITPKTFLISVMMVNNEIGVMQPVKEISALAHKHKILFMTDATQAVGKIPVNVRDIDADLMAFTAHKMYGPKGIGALYVRRKRPRVKVTAQIDGGGHERGMRSGTLAVPNIVGFGKAAELAHKELENDMIRVGKLRDRLEAGLMCLEETYLNGKKDSRTPYISNISFKYVEGEGLMMGFNQHIAVSSGSACTSASLEPSYVLNALGLDDELAHSSIRFSLGRFTTEAQVDYAIAEVTKAVNRMRDLSPLWEMFQEGIDISTIEWAEH